MLAIDIDDGLGRFAGAATTVALADFFVLAWIHGLGFAITPEVPASKPNGGGSGFTMSRVFGSKCPVGTSLCIETDSSCRNFSTSFCFVSRNQVGIGPTSLFLPNLRKPKSMPKRHTAARRLFREQ